MALNSTINTVGVPSASGYPVLSGLISPVYSSVFIKRMYAETIAGQITDQSVVPSELRQSGDLAIMRRAPRGELFKYNKNQALDVSRFNSENITFKVDKAWYWNTKLDEIDYVQIKDIAQWIKAFQDDSMQQLASQIDHDIMQDMVVAAASCNKGARAGVRTHSHNIGAVGVPLNLTATGAVNPLTLTAVMRAVLGEQNAPRMNVFCIWPDIVEPLFLANTVLANAYQSGLGRSSLISGEVSQVMNIKHYFSPNVPTYVDPTTGETTYPIIMGVKSATGFVNQLTRTEVIDKDPRSFARYWRGLQLSGWGVIRPELLAVAYVKVAPIM
jgi:hypothetical protein